MDIYELREALQHKYPTKGITFKLTPECHAKYEISVEEGKIHHTNHALECNRVQVNIEGIAPYFQDLSLTHRENVDFPHIKKVFDGQTKGHVTEAELRNLKKITDTVEQDVELAKLAKTSLETASNLKAKLAPIVMQPDPPAFPNLEGLSAQVAEQKIAEYEAAAQAYNQKYTPSGEFRIELNPTEPTPVPSQPSEPSLGGNNT